MAKFLKLGNFPDKKMERERERERERFKNCLFEFPAEIVFLATLGVFRTTKKDSVGFFTWRHFPRFPFNIIIQTKALPLIFHQLLHF